MECAFSTMPKSGGGRVTTTMIITIKELTPTHGTFCSRHDPEMLEVTRL